MYTINGIPPRREDGNFVIAGERFATVVEGSHRIIISTVIDPLNLCERSGSVGATGPGGGDGPQGPRGDIPTKDCFICIDCDDDCDKPLNKNKGGKLGDIPPFSGAILPEEDPCA